MIPSPGLNVTADEWPWWQKHFPSPERFAREIWSLAHATVNGKPMFADSEAILQAMFDVIVTREEEHAAWAEKNGWMPPP
jgi:hypothetical protein